VDVQHTRLEACVVGFGPGERCWMKNHRIEGDTSRIDSPVWRDLDALLERPLVRDDGTTLRTRLQVIDIGDQADVVSEYVRTRARLQVRAVRGVDMQGMVEPVKRARKRNRYGIEWWQVSNSLTKRALFSRLGKVTLPGPGYIEFDASVTDEMLEQFTAEKLVRQNGRRIWMRISGRANEMIDLWRYGYAGLWMIGGAARDRLHRAPTPAPEGQDRPTEPEEVEETAPARDAAPPVVPGRRVVRVSRPGSGWVNGFRRKE
jgi:phage terminase large subunit GpA-like protein